MNTDKGGSQSGEFSGSTDFRVCVAIFGLLETLQKSNPRSLNSVLRLAEQKYRETSRALIENNESKAPPIDSILENISTYLLSLSVSIRVYLWFHFPIPLKQPVLLPRRFEAEVFIREGSGDAASLGAVEQTELH